ncbi:MAG: histidine kinase [Clostridia bacterium]
MSKNSYKGINKRISIAFILVTCAIVVSVSFVLFLLFQNVMSEQMLDNQKIFLRQNQTNVQNLVNSFNQISVNLTTDQRISDILKKTAFTPLELYNSAVALRQQFERYTNAPLSNYLTTYFSTLYVFDDYTVSKALESSPLEYNVQHLTNVYSAREVVNEAWAQNVISKNGQLCTFLLPDQPQTVFLARLIKNINIMPDSLNQAIGIMVVGLSMGQFKRQVEALSLTPHSEVYIVNQNEDVPQIIYSSVAANAGGKLEDYEKLRLADLYPSGELIRLGHDEYLSMKYSTYWNWVIFSLIPMSDIYEALNPLLWIAVLVCAVGILIGCVVISVISYTVTKPLVNLTAVMQHIKGSGNIATYPRSAFGYHDEITLLYDTFRQMMSRIEQLIKEEYESGVKAKELELIALQAQINPHFIYNALDSINWLALCDGNDDIAEIVSALASIMRYSIQNPNGRVPLSAELVHVENYINIQSKQSRHPIEISFDIDKTYLTFEMPKFLIEPLVENCVIHGLRNVLENGKINISCHQEQSLLILEVSDNGIGADAALLNRYLKGDVASLAHSDGFGIQNIDERIKLHYGSGYGLGFTPNQGGGLTARITLPYGNPYPMDDVEE